MDKLIIGVFGLTGCAGDQLTLLNCEDELTLIDRKVIWRSFNMATSREEPGKIEIALVEGSVCQPDDLALLKDIRERSDRLVALGTCACFGGLPAMDARLDSAVLKEIIYGREESSSIEAIRAQPLSSFVEVDFSLPGCPVEKNQLLETISCLTKGEFPEFPALPVCAECRLKENVCQVIEYGEVCCGALTRGGCGARCPSLGIPCGSCHGPVDDAYYDAKSVFLKSKGITREEIQKKMLLFSAPAGMAEKIEREFE